MIQPDKVFQNQKNSHFTSYNQQTQINAISKFKCMERSKYVTYKTAENFTSNVIKMPEEKEGFELDIDRLKDFFREKDERDKKVQRNQNKKNRVIQKLKKEDHPNLTRITTKLNEKYLKQKIQQITAGGGGVPVDSNNSGKKFQVRNSLIAKNVGITNKEDLE